MNPLRPCGDATRHPDRYTQRELTSKLGECNIAWPDGVEQTLSAMCNVLASATKSDTLLINQRVTAMFTGDALVSGWTIGNILDNVDLQSTHCIAEQLLPIPQNDFPALVTTQRDPLTIHQAINLLSTKSAMANYRLYVAIVAGLLRADPIPRLLLRLLISTQIFVPTLHQELLQGFSTTLDAMSKTTEPAMQPESNLGRALLFRKKLEEQWLNGFS